MKNRVFSVLLGSFLAVCGLTVSAPQTASAYEFGDFKSSTLVSKAWGALGQGDLEGVLAYTNKCLELYAAQAQDMQNSMTDFPATEDKDKVFGFWALNDVATALFIQGEAYRKAEKIEEAKQAFRTVSTVYKFGQTWDPQGWFWKPSEAAKEKLAMLESGSNIDFGNYSSSFLVGQAWKALSNEGFDAVKIYVDKLVELYGEEAKNMQKSLVEYPWESKEKIMSYWALNDVGTALYVQGEALRKSGKVEEAKEIYKKLVTDYTYAQCWDPQGWFWKPAEVAQQALDDLGGADKI